MKVKAIRGSIKYDGIVYDEGDVFDIEATDLDILRENIEIVDSEQSNEDVQDEEEEQSSTTQDNQDTSEDEINTDDEDLNSLNITELKKIAKEKDVKLPEKATKQDIIKAIEESE
jgi:hypothetical protein